MVKFSRWKMVFESGRDSVGRGREARLSGRKPASHLYALAYRGFGLGGGLGIPVVSYAPLPMLVILDESKTAIVMKCVGVVCLWLESGP